ncbi:hypothetical protein V6N13_013850 [Hibiscus sabdariffa]
MECQKWRSTFLSPQISIFRFKLYLIGGALNFQQRAKNKWKKLKEWNDGLLKTVNNGVENNRKDLAAMPSYVPSVSTSNPSGTEASAVRSSQIPDFGTLEHFRIEDAIDLTRNPLFNQIKSNSQALADAQFGALTKTLASADSNLSAAVVVSQPLTVQKDIQPNLPHISVARESWENSNMADGSPMTDTSTDDTDDKTQRFGRGQTNAIVASDSSDRSKDKTDQKTLRRLAQNREAARKSRLRKKAYVQQLESSRLKLTQLEQELQRARQQGIFISSSGDQSHSMSGNGALAFDAEYARWLEEHNRHISELRAAVNSHAGDTELRTIVDNVTAHFDDIFRLKGNAAKADVFHILSGMWKTPAERCFLWIGGFRSSELLKVGRCLQPPCYDPDSMQCCYDRVPRCLFNVALCTGIGPLSPYVFFGLQSTLQGFFTRRCALFQTKDLSHMRLFCNTITDQAPSGDKSLRAICPKNTISLIFLQISWSL